MSLNNKQILFRSALSCADSLHDFMQCVSLIEKVPSQHSSAIAHLVHPVWPMMAPLVWMYMFTALCKAFVNSPRLVINVSVEVLFGPNSMTHSGPSNQVCSSSVQYKHTLFWHDCMYCISSMSDCCTCVCARVCEPRMAAQLAGC